MIIGLCNDRLRMSRIIPVDMGDGFLDGVHGFYRHLIIQIFFSPVFFRGRQYGRLCLPGGLIAVHYHRLFL